MKCWPAVYAWGNILENNIAPVHCRQKKIEDWRPVKYSLWENLSHKPKKLSMESTITV